MHGLLRRWCIIFTLAACLLPAAPRPAPAQDDAARAAFLAVAIRAARQGDWELAERYAGHAQSDTAADLVTWMRLRSGEGRFDEYTAFLRSHRDWPGMARLRRRGEAKVPGDDDPRATIDYFAEAMPETGLGAVRLAEAYAALGRADDATRVALTAWRSMRLTAGEQKVLVDRFGKALAPYNWERADMLLWRGYTDEAAAMVPLLDDAHAALARARIALRRQRPGVDALIAAVPAEVADDPGLAYERFVWRARKGLEDSAVELLRARSVSAAALGRPQAWASRRRSLARAAMRAGKPELAYELASRHFLTDGAAYADLEWLSGYIALRKLARPEVARQHFLNFLNVVETPISLGRGFFWLGLAEEALGNAEAARRAYEDGARHQTSFYGQLAAERIGAPTDPALAADQGADWRSGSFTEHPLLRAALLLQLAEEPDLARLFFMQLARTLDPENLERLAHLVLDLGEPNTALKIAKEAARGGVILPAAYFPVVDLDGLDLAAPPEIVLAIMRRESEFNDDAVSPAGAHGMMQLMPRTAQRTASELDLAYSRNRLTSDWRYNARLGAAYLARVLEEFGGSYILAFAAYNAGPSRARRWVEELGDPRNGEVDPVDFIEHIPFRETRNYVMRVMEAVTVYRIRLAGKPLPIRLSADLVRG